MAVETTETVATQAPSAFAQPFLQFGMEEAGRLYQTGGPQFYGGQTYAAFSPETEEALAQQAARARAGSPLVSQAQATMGSFLGSTDPETGAYIPPAQSGLLTGAIKRALDPVQARVQSQLAQRGRMGSGAAADIMSRAFGDVAADIAYRDFATQREQAMRAAQMAPTMAAADYADIARLQQVGAAREAQAERGIQEAMQRYQYEQLAPYEALQRYQNLVAGFPMGGTTTTVTPYYTPSTGQQFLGGAAIGASLAGDYASPSERAKYGFYGGLLGLA